MGPGGDPQKSIFWSQKWNFPDFLFRGSVEGRGVCKTNNNSSASKSHFQSVLLIGYFYTHGFAKPMVCMRVAFHENDGHHENGENDEDNSDSSKQVVEHWIRGNDGNHGHDENHGNPGLQTTGSPNNRFRNTRLSP